MGQIAPQYLEGQGGGVDPLANLFPEGYDHHCRESLRLLRMAVNRGWRLSRKGMKAAVERMVDLAEHSEDGKIAVGAARVMVAMRDANLRAIESLYKVERLEAGQTTENIGITAATQPVIETVKRISARAGVNAPAE